jgi:ribosomal protein S18 acetylase RimI-like enzyme
MNHPLDRPIFSALSTRHAPLAEGGALAKRYPASIAPFAATENDGEDSLRALAGLAPAGEMLLLLMADPIAVPSGLVTLSAGPAVQMIAERPLDRVVDDRVVQLGQADAADMLSLATLTKPGPFSLRALSLGDFWGVRIDGRLVAMAGERMKQPGYTELSGVCTHPDVRGKGLGRLLSLHVAGTILARGEQPYLHAYATNESAIALYRSLGFRLRSAMHVAAIGRPA